MKGNVLNMPILKEYRERKHKSVEYIVCANGCWECISHSRHKFGYPQINYTRNGKRHSERIFRLVYRQFNGNIEDGQLVRHKCDNPLCINPGHLIIGTQMDNIRDMMTRGRINKDCHKGVKNGRAILTEEQVTEIKLSNKTTDEYMKMYSVARTTVNNIKSGKSWKHLI